MVQCRELCAAEPFEVREAQGKINFEERLTTMNARKGTAEGFRYLCIKSFDMQLLIRLKD